MLSFLYEPFSGYFIALVWRFMGLGYGERVDEMALYKIHAVEGNYTEPDSNVVPTEILWAYKELLVSSYAEERSPLATRRDVVVWNLRCTPGECGVMGRNPHQADPTIYGATRTYPDAPLRI